MDFIEKKYSFLALGDSYTKGESLEKGSSFPYLLVDELAKLGKECVNFKVIAETGWTTGELLQAIEKQKQDLGLYSFVSLLIGVNNQYRGLSLDEYQNELEILINFAIEKTHGKSENVIILSIPDWFYTPFGQRHPKASIVSKEIDEFNEVGFLLAKTYELTYVYITDITRNGLDEVDLVANDELHPSENCYKIWVKRVINQIGFNLN